MAEAGGNAVRSALRFPFFLIRAIARLIGLLARETAKALRDRFIRSRRARIAILAILAIYGLAAYFGVPWIARRIITTQVAAALNRSVRVGNISFNPYTLALDVSNLHISDRSSPQPFADVGHLRVKVSWASLWHLAPVISELTIDRPAIHIVRTAPQRFNFSDLIESPPPPPQAKPAPPSKPVRFSVSNIRLNDGDVHVDDQVLKEQHAVEHLNVGIPFIANLPSQLDVFVQPLLEMVVDGSPVRIAGESKPFSSGLESTVDLKLDRLDLPRYIAYSPTPLPIKLPSGRFSCYIQVHFEYASSQPVIRLDGTAELDQLDVRDAANAPLLGLNHALALLTDVEPLGGVVYLDAIGIDGLSANLVLNRDGTTNLTPLTGTNAPAGSSAATPGPAATSTPQPAPPLEATIESLELSNSAVKLTDNSGATPATVALDNIHLDVRNLQTGEQAPPATFDFGANLSRGGSIGIKGTLSWGQSQAMSDIALDAIDLPALQGFAQSVLAATIASGKLSAKASIATRFASNQFNVHAEPANITLDNFDLRAARGRAQAVAWKQFSVSIGQADLAAHDAAINDVRLDGLRLSMRRRRDGSLSLTSLMRQSAAPPPKHAKASRKNRSAKPTHATPQAPPTPSWRYQIASIALENARADIEDNTPPRPVKIAVAPLNVHLKDVSSDLAKPVNVELDGALNRKGTFKASGTAAIDPLKAVLKVATKGLDLAFADPYISSQMNAVITSAALTMNGAIDLASARDGMRIGYRGNATLGNVTLLDKVTNDDFARWRALSLTGINAGLASGAPKVHIAGVALDDFFARVILNGDGKLNLSDITANPQAAPTSLTQPHGAQAPAPVLTPTPAAVTSPSAAPSQPIAADIDVRQITLAGGHIDYSDNFIRPNYSANLTGIAGKIGTVGTSASQPAPVSLQGQVNGSAPLNIDGSINPLAPMAFVDLTMKANGIELTGLTPYSAKYAGYPIVKGTLNVDVHYLLDQEKLTANNHIFIDQLTFGDRVESKDATNLPVRLAIAILKNSKGEIDLTVPVSGSLSDPQFSFGGVIWQAFKNLIVKAATSPFSLLAAAIGGGSEELGYVEFAPGLATLTPGSEQRLGTIASALQDRPSLKLSISGRVDPDLDRNGLREAAVADQVRLQKAKAVGESANPEGVEVTAAEYDKYLSRAYSAANFPKPRNFVGLAKSIPPDQMKKLMLTNASATDKDLQHLADARANAVRKWLSGKVDPVRLFIAAPQLTAEGIKDQGKTTRADLSLQ